MSELAKSSVWGHASDHLGTFLYRLKKPLKVIGQTLTSVSQGQGIQATALSQGVNKDTVLAWWMRLGEHAPLLWNEVAQGQVRVGAVQFDELHTLIKKRACHLSELGTQLGNLSPQWVWTAIAPAAFPPGFRREDLTAEMIARVLTGAIRELVGDQLVMLIGHLAR